MNFSLSLITSNVTRFMLPLYIPIPKTTFWLFDSVGFSFVSFALWKISIIVTCFCIIIESSLLSMLRKIVEIVRPTVIVSCGNDSAHRVVLSRRRTWGVVPKKKMNRVYDYHTYNRTLHAALCAGVQRAEKNNAHGSFFHRGLDREWCNKFSNGEMLRYTFTMLRML